MVELGGDGGEIGGGTSEEGGEGFGAGIKEGVVDVLIRFGLSGIKDGLGLAEAGEGVAPLVIPDLIRDPPFFLTRRKEDGFRVKPGMTGRRMTNQRSGADSAWQRAARRAGAWYVGYFLGTRHLLRACLALGEAGDLGEGAGAGGGSLRCQARGWQQRRCLAATVPGT